VEVLRGENRRQERLDLEVAGAKDRAQPGLQTRRHLIANEEAIDLRRQELRRHPLLEDDLQDFHAVEVSGTAQERLLTVVVLGRIDLEREVVEVPSGES